MCSYRQRFWHQFAAVRARLGGETRVDSDDLTTSTCSLVGQDRQKRAPSSIQIAFLRTGSAGTSTAWMFDLSSGEQRQVAQDVAQVVWVP